MTITLIRHGRTPGNLRGAFVGSIDQPLCAEGRDELIPLLGGYPAVERVLVSPRLRCRQTAELIYPGRKYIAVDGLEERSFGDFEGLTHDEIIALPGHEDWGRTARSMEFPGGEERTAFFQRVADAFWSAAEQCDRDSIHTAAMILHGGVIMALMESFCTERRDYFDWQMGNGGGYRVACDCAHRTLTLQERLGV